MTRVMVTRWVVAAAAAAVLLTPGVSVAQDGGGAVPADESWESLSPGDLLWLARQITGDDPDRKEARRLLAEHVTTTYLASPDATRSVSCWEWNGFAECLGQDLSATVRTQWQEKILEAYAGSVETLGKLRTNEIYDVSAAAVKLGAPSAARAALAGRIRGVFDAAKAGSMGFDDLKPVCDALNALGARSANEVLVAYTETSPEWRSFEPAKLADLAWRLDSLGETAAEAQTAVAKHVVATYLGSADAIRAIGLEAWGLLTQMGRNLPAEARRAWAKVVRDAFVPRESDLLQMEGRDVARLAWGLEVLDKAQAAAVARIWLTKSERVKTADEGDVIGLAYKAVSDAAASPAEREAIPDRTADLFLSQPDQAADFENCALMVALWQAVENDSKVQEWATKGYACAVGSEAARESATMKMLDCLGSWFWEAGMTGAGKAYPAFAQALVRHAREGTLEPVYPERIASLLQTPEVRQALREQLIDAEGCPRLGVAKVLSWAYYYANETAAWCRFLDDRVESAGDSADTKALWLLARASASSVGFPFPSPLGGKEWLDQAVTVAGSVPVRFLALQELVHGYASEGRYDAAASALERAEDRFAGDEAAVEGVEALRGYVAQARDQAARYAAQTRAQAVSTYQDELRRRLDEARARKDEEAIRRYEELLQGE